MKLLALDTSTEACSAALLHGDSLCERFELAPRRHGDLIVPMMEAVLAEGGATLSDLDALVVGAGPGAFTGVRIAIGLAQGLALVSELPVFQVSSLAAIASGVEAAPDEPVLALIDARMGEVYAGIYRDGELVGEEAVQAPESLRVEGSVHLAGSGAQTYRELLQTQLGERIISLWDDVWPRAGAMARIAAGRAAAGERGARATELEPRYLRNQVAHKPARAG